MYNLSTKGHYHSGLSTTLYSTSSSSLRSNSIMYENKQNKDDIADVFIVPMFSDNYGYIVVDRSTQVAAVVDPGEPYAILNAAKSLGITLQQIWITHKHSDHCGGNEVLLSNIPNLVIYGTKYEPIPAITNPVGEGDRFKLGTLDVNVLYTPCHTSGHVTYYVEPSESLALSSPLLFPGDTLFLGGCGRFFEGTAEQMCINMKRFSELPDNTKVYCAHEYTLSNYKFLSSISKEICSNKYEEIKKLRDEGKSTVPSTIHEELQTNLFMKVFEPEVQKIVGCDSPESTMGTLRNRKNNF